MVVDPVGTRPLKHGLDVFEETPHPWVVDEQLVERGLDVHVPSRRVRFESGPYLYYRVVVGHVCFLVECEAIILNGLIFVHIFLIKK